VVPASGRCFWAHGSRCTDEEMTATPRGSPHLQVRPVAKGSITNPKLALPLAVPPSRHRLSKGSTLSRQVVPAADGGIAGCSRPGEHRYAKSENCHVPAGGMYSRSPLQADARDFDHFKFRSAILTVQTPCSAADLHPPCNGGRDLLSALPLCSWSWIQERLPPTSADWLPFHLLSLPAGTWKREDLVAAAPITSQGWMWTKPFEARWVRTQRGRRKVTLFPVCHVLQPLRILFERRNGDEKRQVASSDRRTTRPRGICPQFGASFLRKERQRCHLIHRKPGYMRMVVA
jgi:hypothetical protein